MGLVRHYWVIFKLVITLVATVVLVAYTGTLDVFAQVASRTRSLRRTYEPFGAHRWSFTRLGRSSCCSLQRSWRCTSLLV